MIGATPEWVSDAGSWVGLVLAVCGVIAACYGFSRWTGRTVAHAVREIVVEELGPVKTEVAALRDELTGHIEDEARAAIESQRWRDEVTGVLHAQDDALRNLQQSQAPHLGGRASEPDPS